MVANALEGRGLSGRRHRYLHDCCKKLYADNRVDCEDSVLRVGACRMGIAGARRCGPPFGKMGGKICRIDFENYGLYFRLNDFNHVNGPDDEFMLSLSKSDGDGVNRIL
ncbi:hypothetical protein FCJ61_24830 [Burkholderia metallica]|uniref:hypothetical protein n=1 Tax=Burkholderia metallica TaxID=488729 RepID=UPI00157B6B0C|nr:hypothetical protein [Burkholderia metallica]NTZ86139.1 hypothetical protein [Burkholderia metallica]